MDKLGNLDAVQVIGDDPSQDGDNIVIREVSEIAEKVNLALAKVTEKGTANVVIMYDIDVTATDIAQLNKLLDENITTTGDGKIFAATNAIVVTPALLNKIPYANKDGLNNLFQLSPESNKYELKNHNYQVLVKDTVAYGETGEWLKVFVPLNGVYFNKDLADARGLKELKDYPDTIDLIMEDKDPSALGVGILSMNALGYVDDEVMAIHSTANAPNSGNPYRIVDKNRKPANPVYGVYVNMPMNENRPEIWFETGSKDVAVRVTKLTIEGCNNVAKLAASVDIARNDLLSRRMDLGSGIYPYYVNNILTLEIPQKGNEFKNQLPVWTISAAKVADPYTITYVCSRIIADVNKAMGNGRNMFHSFTEGHYPLPATATYGRYNHPKSDAKQLGVVLSPEHEEIILTTGYGDVNHNWFFMVEFEIVAGLIMENRQWDPSRLEGRITYNRTINWKYRSELPANQQRIGK